MSRYTPSSYTSRYGSGRDYGLSSTSYSRDRDSSSSSSYRSPYTSSSYSSRPKYSSYASKYSTDLGKSTDKMEDFTSAPIAKDEIEELSYDAKTPTEETAAHQEVLQESQISDFVEEEAEKPTEIEEAKLTLASDPEDEREEEEAEESEEDDEVRRAQELLSSSTQIREPTPVASPVASPVKEVSFAKQFENDKANEAENRTPSPTVLNAKKLGGIPWPPKATDVKKDGAGDAEELPKKRVSDLIARFNTGITDETKKSDGSYKAEYGAGTNVGKVQTHNFA